MPQFDVFRAADGEMLLDCQSEALGHLATRMAVPLLPIERAPERRARLNPVFEVGGESYVMVTQFASAINSRELRAKVTNLAAHRFDIIGAFDMLLTGV